MSGKSGQRFGQWCRARGPQQLPKTVKETSQRWRRCPRHSTRLSLAFCSCKPGGERGKQCHRTQAHTVQSKLRSVKAWFMTDPVRARWRDLSPTQACKSGLFRAVKFTGKKLWDDHWVNLYLCVQNAWFLSPGGLRRAKDFNERKFEPKWQTGESRLASGWDVPSALGFSFNTDKGGEGWYRIIECV